MCFHDGLPEGPVINVTGPFANIFKDAVFMLLKLYNSEKSAGIFFTMMKLAKSFCIAAASAQRPEEIVQFGHRMAR